MATEGRSTARYSTKVSMGKTDIYFKKYIDYWDDGISMKFAVSQALFSSHQVDIGSQRLLRSLQDLHVYKGYKILDLGCGYGPIGLTLAKRYPSSFVHLVDRDALAVEYTRQNAGLNELVNCVTYGSLDYTSVPVKDFDLIISNIPGKAGESVISSLLENARNHIKPDGMVAIVVVTPLAELVATVLKNPGIEIIQSFDYNSHVVLHYRFTSPTDLHVVSVSDIDLYQRTIVEMRIGEYDMVIKTAYGLPEFDSLDYQTSLLLKVLLDLQLDATQHMIVYNPGQGYVPVILWQLFKPHSLVIVGRDLLSLRYACHNLVLNGCSSGSIIQAHQTGWDLDDQTLSLSANCHADCIVGNLLHDEGSEVYAEFIKQAITLLNIGGMLIVAGGSTPITRLLKSVQSDKRLLLVKRRKYQGRSVAVLRRRK